MTSWICVLVVCAWLLPGVCLARPTAWQSIGGGLNEATIKVVAVDPANPRLLYAASSRAVYVSQDGGLSWRQRFRASGSAEVTRIAIDPFDHSHILVATTNGLFGSFDGAAHWKRLFRAAGNGESICQAVLFSPIRRNEAFLGTAGGLFISQDAGRRWRQIPGRLSNRSILSLAVDPRRSGKLYALTDQGLFAGSEDLAAWQRIFVAPPGEDLPEEYEEASEESEPEPTRQPTALAIDPHEPARLYLGTLDGLYESPDGGGTWQRLTQLGLGTGQIRHLILHARSPSIVYAATPQGVARYRPDQERWEALYAGLPTQAVHFLAATDSKIFAATDQGLYALDLTEEQLLQGNWPSAREILANFVHEPTIKQTQEAAIRYAEVEPEKIQRWRRQAYLKALFPTFSVDYDFDRDTYIASSVTATSSRAITLTDPSKSLDVSLNWDLADLIWSTDQTSIDVRSRLMVQLRDDILDELTRSYFERRRLQIELLTEPPADPKQQLDKELRLAELTAMIDGLTGGWFSHQLELNGGNR